ncbi:MAG: Sjogren's syndrome/scleroderma autoantigen 1 family protein [Candidatus Korarchaeum sp.]
MNHSEDDRSKKMAEALLKGWRMLSETCPVCGSPLFETSGGEVTCAVCGAKVILVESEEQAGIEEQRIALERVMSSLVKMLERELLSARSEVNEETLSRVNSILDALEKASSIYRNLARLGRKRK